MNNYAKIVLLKKNKEKVKKLNKINQTLEQIKIEEIDKLKNPSKGQLFVHIDNEKNYFFYQFTGKKWIQIE